MVTDAQVRKLRLLLGRGGSLALSARKTGMDEKTARKYRGDQPMPSQRTATRDYRTRTDPFEEVWQDVRQRLEAEPQLRAVTLFAWLQDQYPGRFTECQRRTFERRVRHWRSTLGPAKTIMFPQVHHPGQIAASDFTVINSLGVTIARARFDHTLFHCVLTYSNVESVSLCFSESFEALSEGTQKAFFEFGGTPARHRTDSLTAAVNNHATKTGLTKRYRELMEHYGCVGEKTNPRSPNENGDVESSNGHIKFVIDQALLLRGSRDFESREQYMQFVEQVVSKRNQARAEKFLEEQEQLQPLPSRKLDANERIIGVAVRTSSTITVRKNTYSVPSRLIGQKVDVVVGAEWIEVTHGGTLVQRMPRLIGSGGAAVNYRHVIDSLVRKPGAFENYRYREDMFPTTHFRIAYDMLCAAHSNHVATRQYLQILLLAAHESQDAVQDALRLQIDSGKSISLDALRAAVEAQAAPAKPTELTVEPPDLASFDSLLQHPDMESLCNDQFEAEQTESPREPHTVECLEDKSSAVQRIGNDDRTPSGSALGEAVDRAVSGASPADVSGPLRSGSRPGGERTTEPYRVPGGTGQLGVRLEAGGPHQALDAPVATTAEQDLGSVRLWKITPARDASAGESPRGIVFGSSGELIDLWQTGSGQVACAVRVGRATGPAGSEHAADDLQLTGSATADRQTGPATCEVDQAALGLRRPDHRRPGICATESRGNGGAVHAARGSLRAWQRAADEQPGVQQVGPDLQRRDDDGSSDRPLGPSQRHHRTERAELPRGNGKGEQGATCVGSWFNAAVKFMVGKSNCR